MRKRFSKFTHGSSVFPNTMRNKQVEFNPYIYTLSKLPCFGYEISVFLIHNRAVFRTAAGTAISYIKKMVTWKNGCQNFYFVHSHDSSRKHWKCKCIYYHLEMKVNAEDCHFRVH